MAPRRCHNPNVVKTLLGKQNGRASTSLPLAIPQRARYRRASRLAQQRPHGAHVGI